MLQALHISVFDNAYVCAWHISSAQSCRLAASMYRIHIHREHSNTWTHGFSHTLASVMTRGATNTLCVLSHSDTCCSDCFPLQRSLKTAILADSDSHSLSCYHLPMVTFTLLETHTLLALSTLLQTSCSLAVQVYSAIHYFTR